MKGRKEKGERVRNSGRDEQKTEQGINKIEIKRGKRSFGKEGKY